MKKIKKVVVLVLIFYCVVCIGFFVFNIDDFIGIPSNGNQYSNNVNDQKNPLLCEDCNLIIISLTNLRKNHLGLYGYKKNISPNIDNFFKNSIIFNNAFAPSGWTFVNAISMFTSLFPYSHNILNRSGVYDFNDTTFFAEELSEAGYKTAAFTSGEDYNSQYSLSKGFDFYLDKDNFLDFNIEYKPGAFNIGSKQLVKPSIDWLRDNKNDKFFLFLQLFDLHCPHTPDKQFNNYYNSDHDSVIDYNRCFMTVDSDFTASNNEFLYPVVSWDKLLFGGSSDDVVTELFSKNDIEKLVSLYNGEIAQADFYLKYIFDFIKREGLEKNTVIVFLSEHGEMLGDNGVFNKVMPSIESFNDIVLNFPMLIRHPNIKNVKNINGLVQIVDIMPTLFDMLGIKDSRNSARQGGSFYNYLNKGGAVNKFVYSGARRSIDSFFFKGMVSTESIRGHKFKFLREKVVDIDTGVCIKERNAFYDIVGDVDQVKNIYNNNIDLANNYNAKIDEWIERIKK